MKTYTWQRKHGKKSCIILGWAILAVTTNPEDIKILPDIKHYSKIKKNVKINAKCMKYLQFIIDKTLVILHITILEIGKKKTNNQTKNYKKIIHKKKKKIQVAVNQTKGSSTSLIRNTQIKITIFFWYHF